MPYPRFTKIIINHVLSIHKYIPKGLSSSLNVIKDNRVLNRIKFVRIGKDAQEYGRAIPEAMLTDSIKESDTYKAFLSYSTGLVSPKKTKGKSISKTDAEIADETRRAHEIHAHLVTEKVASEEASDDSKPANMPTSIDVMTDEERFAAETKKAMKSSRQESREATRTLRYLEVQENKDDDDDDDDKSIDLEKTDDEDDDDEYTTHDETITYAEEEESDDEDRTDTDSDEQVMDDTRKMDQEKVEDEGELLKTTRKEKSDFPLSSSSKSTSSNFEIPPVLSASLLDMLVFVIPPQSTPTPTSLSTQIPAPPSSTIAPNVITIVPYPIPAVVQRVSHVPTVVNEYLRTILGDTFHKVLKKHIKELIQQFSQKDVSKIIKVKHEQATKEKMPKYSTTPYDEQANAEHKQKDIIFRMMMASKSYERHLAHKALYDALLESIYVDADNMDKLAVDPASQRKRRHEDKDEDPSAGSGRGKKKRKHEDKSESSKKYFASKESSKGKIPPKTSKNRKSKHAEETVEEATHEVEIDVEEPIQKNDGNKSDQPLSEDIPKTSRAPNINWFKQPPRPPTLFLEWNTVQTIKDEPEQICFNDMMHAKKTPFTFDKLMATPIDLSNFTMNRLNIDNLTQEVLLGPVYNLLKGCLGHLIVAVEYFFNNNLEDLKSGSEERSVQVEKLHGYGHLKEIVVRRAYRKLYKFREGNFRNLHLNDIEDMLLLSVQHKLFNLEGSDIVDLALALRIETSSLTLSSVDYEIQSMVDVPIHQEDPHVQRTPLVDIVISMAIEKSTPTPSPPTTQAQVTNISESDSTSNFKEKTNELLKFFDNLLLERWIMRSLECYAGGRLNETDYRLKMRTI
ncbi:hypothetical protein Tco_0776317 [Tanacetum coccineum]